MVAGPIARQQLQLVQMRTFKDDPLSFRSLRKICITTARESEPQFPGDAHGAPNPLLVYMYEALALEQKQELLLALESEPGNLKKEPKPTATLPAPWGGGKWSDRGSPIDQGKTTRR
jgi:hypothetical protein